MKSLFIFLVFVAIIRLFSIGALPLMDTTEARYGEIARKMAETNDWITPQHAYGVPFWAKPPLYTWVSALSLKAFGVNEFAVRFPSFILALSILLLIWSFSYNYLALLILSTTAFFYIAAGAVMTDSSLLFSCTLAMISFYNALFEKRTLLWGAFFFIALGIALLAKGPVAIVLITLPIFFWLTWTKKWSFAFKQLPWMHGIPTTLLIALPWYFLAEQKTPGFLEYFILGEHFKRFLLPGWSGDLYGVAHREPIGTIWWFFFINSLPWTPFALYFSFKQKLCDKDRFLLAWCLVPILFFTCARNILISYPLVSLPPLSLLLAKHLSPFFIKKGKISPWAYLVASIVPLILLIFTLGHPFFLNTKERSAKHLCQLLPKEDFFYAGKRLYSMEFYANGRAHHVSSMEKIPPEAHFLVLTKKQQKKLSKKTLSSLECLGETNSHAVYEKKTS